MRVLLDTNILARSAGPAHGLARELVQIVTHHRHDLLMSPFLVTELGRVLRYDRVRRIHGFSEVEIDQFVADLLLVAAIVSPGELISVAGLADPDDAAVIQTAINGKAEVLCTLDRHLLQTEVKAYCRNLGVAVLTDVELMAQLRGSE